MTNAQFENLCLDCATLTDTNEHTRARILICDTFSSDFAQKFDGDKCDFFNHLSIIFTKIAKSEHDRGFLTGDMAEVRQATSSLLLAEVKRILRIDQFNALCHAI